MRNLASGAAVSILVFGVTNALDTCESNVLAKAYEGLNVNAELVSCMTQHKFSAALDGSVDLAVENAASAPDHIKALCTADSCKTILSVLVKSENFNLTNCIVNDNIVLMAEVSKLQATCMAISTPESTPDTAVSPNTAAAPNDTPTAGPTGTPVSELSVAPTAAPTDVSTVSPTNTPTAPSNDAPPAPLADAPTAAPTAASSNAPTNVPTSSLPDASTAPPADASTAAPTAPSTDAPIAPPTNAPTAVPTYAPSDGPTDSPTAPSIDTPTAARTDAPTGAPTNTKPPAPNAPTDSPAGPPPTAIGSMPPLLTDDTQMKQTTAESSDNPTQVEPDLDQTQQTTTSVPNSGSGFVPLGKFCV